GLRLLEEQDEEERGEEHDRRAGEAVLEGEDEGLHADLQREDGLADELGRRRLRAERAADRAELLLRGGRVRRDRLGEIRAVDLRTAIDEEAHPCGADRSAELAGQVEEAGGVAALVGG